MALANTIETKIGNRTVGLETHEYSVWFILALRLMMGYAFLVAGIDKVLAGGWTANGYLANVATQNGNPLEAVFAWMLNTPLMMDFINIAVPWGELFIGIALLIGLATRLAAFWGAFMMGMFYFGNWGIEHGLVNGDFAYLLVFLAVGAFGAGRVLGLDQKLESHEIVEKYPQLKYLLG